MPAISIHSKAVPSSEGSLTILDTSFNGFQEVYQQLYIRATLPTNASQQIGGFRNTSRGHRLCVHSGIAPRLQEPIILQEFRHHRWSSINRIFRCIIHRENIVAIIKFAIAEKVRSGSVAILENKDLCFASSIDWKLVMRSNTHNKLLQSNSDEDKCRKCSESNEKKTANKAN